MSLDPSLLEQGFAQHFALDPGVDYLNHGLFGACPRAVLDAQHALRERLERGPTRFLGRELEGMIDGARSALTQLIDAPAEQHLSQTRPLVISHGYFPSHPRRLLRVCAQAYNTLPQYERLARVLESELARARES